MLQDSAQLIGMPTYFMLQGLVHGACTHRVSEHRGVLHAHERRDIACGIGCGCATALLHCACCLMQPEMAMLASWDLLGDTQIAARL